MAKRWDANHNYLDKIVDHRVGFVALEFDTKIMLDRLLNALNATNRKNAVEHIGTMIVETFLPFVPRQSGDMAKEGLYVRTKALKSHGELDIKYRNTAKLKYVLYQYFGIVYGPNYAVWEIPQVSEEDLLKNRTRKRMIATHAGWVSKRGKGTKRPTSRKLGTERPDKHLSDGRVIHYNGYTNKQSQAKWLEYIRDNPEIWIPLTRRIENEIKEMFGYTFEGTPIKLRSLNDIHWWKEKRIDDPRTRYAKRYKPPKSKPAKKETKASKLAAQLREKKKRKTLAEIEAEIARNRKKRKRQGGSSDGWATW